MCTLINFRVNELTLNSGTRCVIHKLLFLLPGMHAEHKNRNLCNAKRLKKKAKIKRKQIEMKQS